VINRRNFIKNTIGSAAYIGLAGFNFIPKKLSNDLKPNIIFILTDDLGSTDLSCYGQKLFSTPNIDTIAQNGMKFTQFYSGSSLCAPSRCTLLTGKHQGHATVRHNQKFGEDLKEGELTIASMLKTAGYSTACIGKWGVGHNPAPDSPNKHGFDYHFGYVNMWHAHNYYPEFLYRNGEKVYLKNKVKNVPKDKYFPDLVGWAYEKHEYSHDLFIDEAVKYIDKTKDPFFMYLALTIPHENGEADLFNPDDTFEVPDLGPYADKPWTRDEKGKAAMIDRMDKGIGAIIKKLKEKKLFENTIIAFTSDNGGNEFPTLISNYPLRGYKNQFYEGGIRVPFLIQWPKKIKSGTTSDHIAAFYDVMPTLGILASASKIPENDGISFASALMGKTQKQHEYLYWEMAKDDGFQQVVRYGEWKAICNSDYKKMNDNAYTPEMELYNLKNDISETKNVVAEHLDLVEKIKSIIKKEHSYHPGFKPLTQN
jgi:arylsulfatase A-like enzyme